MGLRVACVLPCLLLTCPSPAQAPPALEAACARAGDNAPALRSAWQDVPPAQRPALEFLLEHMPDADARALSAEFLLRQVDLATAVRAQVPWGAALPDALFFGHVLPYAQANEAREDWRSDFVRRFVDQVKDCKTPGEAALRLNATIFAALDVHYSTGRARADQAPSASIAQGKASCTGLSILLADACRACCVPARLVSVRWPHKAGNHTWVEVWDGAAWRFVGADEPDPAGFDRAWFVGDAAKAAVADREHRPWAVSFANTGERFAAGWGRGIELWGEDVGARYAPKGWSDGHGGTIPTTLPFDLGTDPAAAALAAQLDRFFAAEPAARARFEFDRNLDEELKTAAGDARLRALVFAAWQRSERIAAADTKEAPSAPPLRQLSWTLADAATKDHHWLHVDAPEKGLRVEARIDGQRLEVLANRKVRVQVFLDARLCDLREELAVRWVQSVVVVRQGEESVTRDTHDERVRPSPSLRTLCATMAERRDPALAATWVLTL